MRKYLISGYNNIQETLLDVGVYTLVVYVKSMFGSVYTFSLFNGTEWESFDIDVIKGEWCKVYRTFEITEKKTKFNPIHDNYSSSKPVFVHKMQLSKGNLPSESGASPFDIDQILDDLHDEIDGIEDFTNKAFADGILDKTERIQLRSSLEYVETIVESVRGSYDKIVGIDYIPNTIKKPVNPYISIATADELFDRYSDLIRRWEGSIQTDGVNGLKTVIINILEDDNIVDATEIAQKDLALSAFNSALYNYNQAEKEVYNSIGDDYSDKIDEAIIKATYWVIDSSSPVIYKDASDVSIAGYHTPVVVRGELRRGDSVVLGGFITITPNGSAEGTATASPRTISPANSDGKTSYKVRLYKESTKQTLLDEMTIPVVFSGSRGVNAINIALNNEKDTVPALANGFVTDYSGTGTNIRVFEGATELEYGASTNGRYTVSAVGSGVAVGSISKSGLFCLVGNAKSIAVDKSDITFTISGKTITGDSFSVEKKQTITRAKTGDKGDTGEDAPLLYLSASSQVMNCDPNNNAKANQNIEIEAKVQNVLGAASFVATPFNSVGTALAKVTLGYLGSLRTLKNTQWLTTYNKVEIVATLGVLTDKITIHRLADPLDGESTITGYLTNENITLQASSTGVVSSFANAKGDFMVHYGESVVSSGVGYSRVSQVGCNVSIDSAGKYSVLSMSSDDAVAKFKATYKGVDIIRELKLSKSKQGAGGDKGDTGDKGKDAKTINISSRGGDVIKVDKNGVITPIQIIVKAQPENTTIEKWYYQINGGSEFLNNSSSVTTGVTRSGYNITINSRDVLFDTLTIRATNEGSVYSDPNIVVEGTLTVKRVSDGSVEDIDLTKLPIPYIAGEWSINSIYKRTETSFPVVSYKKVSGRPLYYFLIANETPTFQEYVKPTPYDYGYAFGQEVFFENKIWRCKVNDTKQNPTENPSRWTDVTASYAPNLFETHWKLSAGFDMVITDAIFANFAKLGSAVFNGDRMISQKGVGVNGVSESFAYELDGKKEEDESSPNFGKDLFTPNLSIDFLRGILNAVGATISGEINTSPTDSGARIKISGTDNAISIYDSTDTRRALFAPLNVPSLSSLFDSLPTRSVNVSSTETFRSATSGSGSSSYSVYGEELNLTIPEGKSYEIKTPSILLKASADHFFDPTITGVQNASTATVTAYLSRPTGGEVYLGSVSAFAMALSVNNQTAIENRSSSTGEHKIIATLSGRYRLRFQINLQVSRGSAVGSFVAHFPTDRTMIAIAVSSVNTYGLDGVALVNSQTDYVYSNMGTFEVSKGNGGIHIDNSGTYVKDSAGSSYFNGMRWRKL